VPYACFFNHTNVFKRVIFYHMRFVELCVVVRVDFTGGGEQTFVGSNGDRIFLSVWTASLAVHVTVKHAVIQF
jgi:hypothetical protein